MDIRPVSQQTLNRHPIYRGAFGAALWEERAWFAAVDDRVLGIVSYDKLDHDWNYVVLTSWEDERGYTPREARANGLRPGEYVAVDVGVSCPSQKEAERRLQAAMARVGVEA